jgi:coenzyme F420-reducing hydrogenase beta subunit
MDFITSVCTGCRACEQICPQKAISFNPDEAGFFTAVIDQNKCIDCKLCLKTCPQNNHVQLNNPQKIFAAQSKNVFFLKKSASGGIFATFAKSVLDEKGIVYGVKYDNEWNAVFSRATKEEDLVPLLSSKYVQANTQNSFLNVKKNLQENKKVLYCGTGCQIAGLKSFLKRDYSNLLTIDIVCHGVASPVFFKKYIQWKEKKESGKISFYNFRSKANGWGLEYEYEINGKRKTAINSIDPYYFSFLKGYSYRECCYGCNYSKPQRCGDITICDYWGIEKEHPKFPYDKGASAVLINTVKGLSLWNESSNLFTVEETTFEQVAKYNENLYRPTQRNSILRDNFYKGIMDNDSDWFSSFANNFKPSLAGRVKALMPSKLLHFLKKLKKCLT